MGIAKHRDLLVNYVKYYGHYQKIKKSLDRFDHMTAGEIQQYQFEKLKKLVWHAYLNVPYYQRLFDNIGFHPNDFVSMTDFSRIPFLTKQIIRENQEDLRARNIPERYVKRVQTGGTTGMPTEFLLDKRYATLTEMVFLRHMWKKIGYRNRDKCIVLREDNVENIIENKIYWKKSILTNWLIMSAFHLNSDTFSLYYEKIRAFRPRFILAFPSNALLLARYMKEFNLEPFEGLKGVICASENLYDWQRKYMTEVYLARIFSYYGHSEKCVLATKCLDRDGFAFYPPYGYAELVNDAGESCRSEGERGEIVATGFNNYISPFIRYRTDDVAIYTKNRCNKQNQWFTIRNIEGRKQDFLIDRDNIPKTYLHIDRPFWNLREKVFAYQYIQKQPGKVTLHIHPKDGLDDQELAEIRRIFHQTYFKFDLEIHLVDNIPRTKGGKFKYLDQKIPINDFGPSKAGHDG